MKRVGFNNWLDKIEKLGPSTIEVIKKNKHKFYLRKWKSRCYDCTYRIYC
jgi:hypothetical protein